MRLRAGFASMIALSLGAGVQSSTLALMCARGEITPVPEVAVFADTQNESPRVYGWLDWLAAQLPFPIHKVTIGNLAETALRVRTSRNGIKYIKPMIPAFVLNQGSRGMVGRQCTSDFKIVPILRELRRLRAGRHVTQYIGISFDEYHRMKPSRNPWLSNSYPLVERRLTRLHCLEWMSANGYPKPPRSACVYCPYHSDEEWMRLRDEEPEQFAAAVVFEKRYQESFHASDMDGTPFLHASRQPLETVKFSNSPQVDAFGNDCLGMCGV